MTTRDVEDKQINQPRTSRRRPRWRSLRSTRGGREAAEGVGAAASARRALVSQTGGLASNRASAKDAAVGRGDVPEARVLVEIHEASNKRVERTGGDARRPCQEVIGAGRSPARSANKDDDRK